MSDKFSANESMIGYFYQPLYALFLLLKNNIAESIDTYLLIETLDDIEFRESNSILNLCQTKHHISKQASISDKSEDLWKTIRIWTERIKNNQIDLDNVYFILTTTVKASGNSIASELRLENRNIKSAIAKLSNISDEGCKSYQARLLDPSINKHTNEEAYLAFESLNENLKKEFIKRIYIFDECSDIIQIQSDLKNKLKYACRANDLEYFLEKLIGWWYLRVINQLTNSGDKGITYLELDEKISEIRDEFKNGNLPIDYENEFNNISEDNLSEDEKIFIEQLKIIAATPTCLGLAISDYYKAYQQRCNWVRKGKIFDDGLKEYDDRLVNEWVRLFDSMRDEINNQNDETELKKAGRQLLNIMGQRNLPICENSTHKVKGFYIMRGSYHILANGLKIGWHPYFNKILCNKHSDYVEGKCFTQGFNNKICDLILQASGVV